MQVQVGVDQEGVVWLLAHQEDSGEGSAPPEGRRSEVSINNVDPPTKFLTPDSLQYCLMSRLRASEEMEAFSSVRPQWERS
ncbi:hypothetical protein EYF80_012329 [Liparis tanakae]|uniref:Uncharacterized protein n=1 Tax=Liparis tanakae TaxID=230148 RepID=A0A4Z2IIH7_9TELE|nr:hypothetical protein EYF80_012329 [Liparis tanakae]